MSTATLKAPPPIYTEAIYTGLNRWTSREKFLFRVLFIFTIMLVIPFEPSWYESFFNSRSFFWYLSSLAGYRPNLIRIDTESGRWGFVSYATWGLALLIALVGALIWTWLVRKKETANYNLLYYWTRVVIRYRIGAGLIAFGFLKVYPMQMPYPSLSNLLTDFGDYNTYKLYWQHVGVSLWYEVLLGWVEVIGGILMFFRATVFIGALINAGVLFNIAHANFAYDGGVHVYSSFFVLFSLILLIPYAINIWNLVVLKKNVTPRFYYPPLRTVLSKRIFYVSKYAIVILFTVVYGLLRYEVHYKEGYLKEPVTPGLANAAGYYNVTAFQLNGKELPYNPLDSVRWHNVVFEKWSTLVYKVHKPFPISLANGTPNGKDVDRNYELAGIAGGQRFLYYDADTVQQVLKFWDKNKRGGDGESGRSRRNNNRRGEASSQADKEKANQPTFVLSYERPSDSRIILKGLTEKKDSLYVVLDRIERDFPIQIKREYSSLLK